MTTEQPGQRQPPEASRPDGVAVLVEAIEGAAAAIYCVAGSGRTVWANASARRLGSELDQVPSVDGRRLPAVVEEVAGSGRAETLRGPLGEGGPTVTVAVRALPVAGGPGAMAIIEHDDALAAPWPVPGVHAVEGEQSLLYLPFLQMLPDLALACS